MEIEGKIDMEQKKHWIFRPLAWICTIALVLGLQLVAELLCRFGEYAVTWLGGLPTVAIVLLVLAFGSIFCSLFFYTAFLLPPLIVTASNKIYPSRRALRYYFIGGYEILGCTLLIVAAVAGYVSGGSMFWFYARYAWLIFASIIMMIAGNGVAKDQAEENQPKNGGSKAPVVALSCAVAILGAVCMFLFLENSEATAMIDSLNQRIEAQNTTIEEQSSELDDLRKMKASYNLITKYAKGGNIGAASNQFKADRGIVVLDKKDRNQKIKLTTSFGRNVEIEVDYAYPKGYGAPHAAELVFDESEWYGSTTTLTVRPYHAGACVAIFKNSVNDQVFKVLIIVT